MKHDRSGGLPLRFLEEKLRTLHEKRLSVSFFFSNISLHFCSHKIWLSAWAYAHFADSRETGETSVFIGSLLHSFTCLTFDSLCRVNSLITHYSTRLFAWGAFNYVFRFEEHPDTFSNIINAVAAPARRLERYSVLRRGNRDAQRPDFFPFRVSNWCEISRQREFLNEITEYFLRRHSSVTRASTNQSSRCLRSKFYS